MFTATVSLRAERSNLVRAGLVPVPTRLFRSARDDITVYTTDLELLYDETVDIHMVTLDRGICYQVVWSKCEGKGRVAHIALGHGSCVWELPSYKQLMLQAVKWLAS